MTVKRIISSIMVCAAVFTLSSCKSTVKDDFYEDDLPQPTISEIPEMTTEFTEYDGNTEKISVTITNNSNKNFNHGEQFFLQKLDDEWRYIKCQGPWNLANYMIKPSQDVITTFDLKEHVRLPLLPGLYRIGFYEDKGESTPVAEFTIKE